MVTFGEVAAKVLTVIGVIAVFILLPLFYVLQLNIF